MLGNINEVGSAHRGIVYPLVAELGVENRSGILRDVHSTATANKYAGMTLKDILQDIKVPRTAKVVSVYDGDTVTLDTGDHVRIRAVNCPEKRPMEEFALEARQATLEFLLGKTVTLGYPGPRKRDHYKRLLATVRTDEGDLTEHLLSKGLGHLFIVDKERPANYDRLLAAQTAAQEKGLGIWKTERFEAPLTISAFHANGRGNDVADPNCEYFRLVNTTPKPISVRGYTVTNAAGEERLLPNVKIQPGRSLMVCSGTAEMELMPRPNQAFLGSKDPFWSNEGDLLTVKDNKGRVVIQREYKGRIIDPTALPNPVTQKKIHSLGADVEIDWMLPKSIEVTDYIVDDGDTIFIRSPFPGTIRAEVEGVKRDVEIADQKYSPAGYLAIRFKGVDTPETHVATKEKKADGTPVEMGQGRPGEISKNALARLMKSAAKVEVRPARKRPFDVYNRMLGEVWVTLKDGTEINTNEWLVQYGHGEFMASFEGDSFDEAQFNRRRLLAMEAVQNERGIYGNGPQRCDERPADFRRRAQSKPPSRWYVIDYENKMVYESGDADRVAAYNRIWVNPRKLARAVERLDLSLGFDPAA